MIPLSKHKQTQTQQSLPWYKVPILWLGLVLTLAMVAALAHLIYLSYDYDNPAPVIIDAELKDKKDIKAWRGTPLQREGEHPQHWQRFEPDNQELRLKRRKQAEQELNEQ